MTEMLIALLIISLTSVGLFSLTNLYARSIARVQTNITWLSARNFAEQPFADFASQLRGSTIQENLACDTDRVAGLCKVRDGTNEPCTMRLVKTGAVWRLEISLPGQDVSASVPFRSPLRPEFACKHDDRGTSIVLNLVKGTRVKPWLITAIESGGEHVKGK